MFQDIFNFYIFELPQCFISYSKAEYCLEDFDIKKSNLGQLVRNLNFI